MKNSRIFMLILIAIFTTTMLISVTAQNEPEHLSLHKKGLSAFQKGDFAEAVSYFDTALAKSQGLPQNKSNYAFMLNNYSNLGLALKKLNYFEEALQIYGELVEYAPYDSSIWYFNMAQCYQDKGKFYNNVEDFDKAIKTLEMLLDRKSKVKDFSKFENYLYGDLGENYMLKGDYSALSNPNYSSKSDFNKCIKYSKSAIELINSKSSLDANDKSYLARMNYNIGLIYYRNYTSKTGKNDQKFLNKLTTDINSLKSSKSNDDNQDLKNALDSFKEAIKNKKDFTEANEAIKKLSPLAITELKEEKKAIQASARVAYAKAKKDEAKSEENEDSPEVAAIRQAMLSQLNKDRAKHSLAPVSMDPLCVKVGDKHTKEEQKYTFLGHQLQDGYNPYYHYSQAGGNDYNAQNAAARWGYSDDQKSLDTIIDWVLDSQYRMYSEVAPNDGHRKCMLDKNHNYVGIGIAYSNKDCFVNQEFINRYATISDVPRNASLSEVVILKGTPLSSKYKICGASIFYEPFPKTLTPEEINNIWHYSLPAERTNLYPVVEGCTYRDGSKGDIKIDESTGSFEYPVKFYKNQQGVYTAVTWFVDKTDAKSPSFPITSISINAN